MKEALRQMTAERPNEMMFGRRLPPKIDLLISVAGLLPFSSNDFERRDAEGKEQRNKHANVFNSQRITYKRMDPQNGVLN
jgi:hypothetical protein